MENKTEPTEEQKEIDAFLKEYGEIVAKYKLDILAIPSFIPDGQGAWKVVINTRVVSTKDQPVKSPFMAS